MSKNKLKMQPRKNFMDTKKMHPRNIYNKRLDFKAMAEQNPDFKHHTTLDITGQVSVDFKDPEALRALAKALLKKDFNLNIDIPANTLVPTVPLRLNYILFIEDLLAYAKIDSNVIGLDIGTGASCIYPLLSVKKNNWHMVATDCNDVNIRYARNNVAKNYLEAMIKIVEVSPDTTIKEVLDKDGTQYAFCMCNPPFFGALHELSSLLKSRKPFRRPPRNAFCAAPHEVVTDGGEVEFISKIIKESHDYKDRIKIFTTMLGIKASCQPILDMLRASTDVKSIAQTEFFQGHVCRWSIAWTFDENLDLSQVPGNISYRDQQKKKKKPFVHKMKYKGSIDKVGVALQTIFDRLQINYKIIEKSDTSRQYNVVAYFDTWTGNRQKRRETGRMSKLMEGVVLPTKSTTQDTPMDFASDDIAAQEESFTTKRKLDDSDDYEDVNETKKVFSADGKTLEKLVDGTMYANITTSWLTIELDSFVENTNRSRLHDILQYIKNHINLEFKNSTIM